MIARFIVGTSFNLMQAGTCRFIEEVYNKWSHVKN